MLAILNPKFTLQPPFSKPKTRFKPFGQLFFLSTLINLPSKTSRTVFKAVPNRIFTAALETFMFFFSIWAFCFLCFRLTIFLNFPPVDPERDFLSPVDTNHLVIVCRTLKIIHCNTSNSMPRPRAYRHRQLTCSIAITSRKSWPTPTPITWRRPPRWARCRPQSRRTASTITAKWSMSCARARAWCDANCPYSTITIHHQITHRTHM